MIGEHTSIGIVRTSWNLLKSYIQLVPCNALKEHTKELMRFYLPLPMFPYITIGDCFKCIYIHADLANKCAILCAIL